MSTQRVRPETVSAEQGFRYTLFLTATLAIGLNLRGAIVGVPPLIGQIGDELSVPGPALGLLTSLPLICFAVVSPLVAVIAGRFGMQATLAGGMMLLAVSLALRPWNGFALLLAGSVAVGLAIATGNVLVPAVVRQRAGGRASVIMGLTTASYGVGACVWAWVSAPVAEAVGWRSALAILAIPAAAAALIAFTDWHLRIEAPEAIALVRADAGRRFRPWNRAGSWWLSLYFGTQSLLFFGTSTWLPAELTEQVGASPTDAAMALALFQGAGVFGMLAVPLISRFGQPYRAIGMVSVAGWLAMFLGLVLTPSAWLIWVGLGGVAQGMGVSLALVLVAVRPTDPKMVRSLSAMVQTVGYAIAAVGPVALAAIVSATGTWTSALWVCVGLVVLMIGLTLAACSRKSIQP